MGGRGASNTTGAKNQPGAKMQTKMPTRAISNQDTTNQGLTQELLSKASTSTASSNSQAYNDLSSNVAKSLKDSSNGTTITYDYVDGYDANNRLNIVKVTVKKKDDTWVRAFANSKVKTSLSSEELAKDLIGLGSSKGLYSYRNFKLK